MQPMLRPLRFAGSVGRTLTWLLVPLVLHAQSSHQGNASPSPSPSSRHHRKDAQSAESESPTPKPADPASPTPEKANTKSSSADEAAPSRAAANGSPSPAPAATSSVEPGEIENFDAQPEAVRQLLTAALALTKQNLTYTYGSADPSAGGMDCSGTIYYLLRQRGFGDTPRQASEQYSWVREKSRFYAVVSKKQDNPELKEMRPGDLLFWTGTYNVDRDPPVTHTMIYLGQRKKDGHRLMIGSSDGRTYDGQRRNGVSVFDFHLPPAREGDAADAATAAAPDHAPNFVGYGPIPGMVALSDAASRQTAAAHATPSTSPEKKEASGGPSPGPTPKGKRSRSQHHTDTDT